MKKMNIGLVGAGFMGKAHMVAFSNMPKLFTDAPFIPVFKTVCDIVPEIAEDFKGSNWYHIDASGKMETGWILSMILKSIL